MTYILWPEQCRTIGEVGGKAGRLAALRAAGFQIPDWFVLSPRAFDASLSEADRVSLATAGADGFSSPPNLHVAADVCVDLSGALRSLCKDGERVAVRSSGFDEDDLRYSFAGQHETFLSVEPEHVPELVANVWQSAFSDRVVAYRQIHGLPLPRRPPAVLIQRLVDADVAGAAFGSDPVTGRRAVAVVAAAYGLGSALVNGETDADTFRVTRGGQILERTILAKRMSHRPVVGPGSGVRVCPVPDALVSRPALDDGQVVEVAELARRAGRHFGGPQDIEWAIEGGRLYLLQSRPMTTLGTVADPDGALNLWDNSNVAESYPGITLPLTFSFARHVYEEVYKEFCRLVGVPASVIAAHHDTFGRMLGLVRGRVYYNLLSWYRLLALLPGFTLNRGFMEQMMGVTERVSDEPPGVRRSTSTAAKAADALRLVRTVLGLVTSHALLARNVARFTRRLDQALSADVNLDEARADEVVAHYRALERALLRRWDAPLVNDFFAMVFYGLLGRVTRAWCHDEDGTLRNGLIAAQGGIVSTEPAQRVSEMARLAGADPALVTALCDSSSETVAAVLARDPDFHRAYGEYLKKFGDRCFEELKLESPTLVDDPVSLLKTIGHLARSSSHRSAGAATREPCEEPESKRRTVRSEAERRTKSALVGGPIRRVVLGWMIRQTRSRVRDRENLRFERTRVFGRVRRIFRALGRELAVLGVLTAADDIFYLQVDEVLGFVEGTAVTTDLKGLVEVRKNDYRAYREGLQPDDRFETRGIVYTGNTFRRASALATGGDERRGIGCCPGSVEGPVSIIADPRLAQPSPGAIVVAERTDPAWVVLFSTAAGVVVERGSLLSHSAIIAREMGVPTIVAVPGVTRWLQSGDRVQMDGQTGIVRRLGAVEEMRHAG